MQVEYPDAKSDQVIKDLYRKPLLKMFENYLRVSFWGSPQCVRDLKDESGE